jgi:hypothetical protein
MRGFVRFMSAYPSKPDIKGDDWHFCLVPIADFLQERSYWAQLPAPFEYKKSESSTGSYEKLMHALGFDEVSSANIGRKENVMAV